MKPLGAMKKMLVYSLLNCFFGKKCRALFVLLLMVVLSFEQKLKLRSDCDREIEQVRRKYEIKLQEMESEFMLKKQELDANESKVLMNKIVAAAFRSKWMDMKASSGGMQQGMQLISLPLFLS